MTFLHPFHNFLAFCAVTFLGLANIALANSAATDSLAELIVKPASTAIHLDVYKSETCLCCSKWISNLESMGFHAITHHPIDFNQEEGDHNDHH